MAQSAPPTRQGVRLLRGIRVGLHLLWAAMTVASVYPFIGHSRRLWLKQRWSRQLLEILAVRLDAQLSGAAPGSLFVINHVSWLDIYALNAARPMAFVAKAEVSRWPLVGWLSANTDTLFLSRESRRQAREMNARISELLVADTDVACFPEGTTSDGERVLKFHSALLQSAIDSGRPVQPVALAYYDAEGRRSQAPVYAGEITMGESLGAILACRSLTVRLRPTPPLDPQIMTRGQMAQAAHSAIAFNLGLSAANDVAERLLDQWPDSTAEAESKIHTA